MFRCGQITHFALQALVVSIRTVLGKWLNARLNALPMKEHDILDSFVLFCPVLLITICPLSDLPVIACHPAPIVPQWKSCSCTWFGAPRLNFNWCGAGDVQNARPYIKKNHIVGFQLSVFNPRLSESRSYFAMKICICFSPRRPVRVVYVVISALNLWGIIKRRELLPGSLSIFFACPKEWVLQNWG